jgi:hypothetical protein
MELSILVAAAVLEAMAFSMVALVDQALSLFVTQILIRQRHQPLAHQQLQCLAAFVSTNLQVQGVLHSDGTLCTTQ